MILIGNLNEEESKALLPDGDMILLGYRGSKAHGMFVPSTDPNSFDDIDLMGVYVAPLEHYLGFGRSETCDRFIGEWDVVSYELRKFVNLLVKNNPNVVSMLWLKPEDILFKNDIGDALIRHRDLFSSKLAFTSFAGYANGQLKRMTHLNQGALSEIANRTEQLESLNVTFIDGVPKLPAGAPARTIELARQYMELRSRYFSGYMGHKRKGLVEKYGYDTKNAAHLIRLLRMCVEFLNTGVMNVWRSDAQELLGIKRGEWSLEKVQSEAELLFQAAHDAKESSPLPDEPDKQQIEQLLVDLLTVHFVD